MLGCWTFTYTHVFGHTHTRSCVPGVAPAYRVVCYIMSHWKKLALSTLSNHRSSKLQQLYQLIKCTSLKGTCHEGDLSNVHSKSLWWSKHIVRDMNEGQEEEDERTPASLLWLPAARDWEITGSNFIFLSQCLLSFKTGGCKGEVWDAAMRWVCNETDLFYCVLILRLRKKITQSLKICFLNYNM